jgi:hypothetical protein
MSRTTLCVLTALGLSSLSLLFMLLRSSALGEEVHAPRGPGTWRITLVVEGKARSRAKLWTAVPLDTDRQRVLDAQYFSDQFTSKPPHNLLGEQHRVVWSPKQNSELGRFQTRSEFLVKLVRSRTGELATQERTGLHAPPRPGEYLSSEERIESDHDRVSDKARELTEEGIDNANQLDIAQALFHFVEQRIHNELRFQNTPLSALACLERGAGDRAARCRLLVALLRNRNIPARMVQGLTLSRGPEQMPHYWVEAFVHDHWLAMCPTYRLFGRVNSTYLIFAIGDRPLVSSRNVSDLQYAFLVERLVDKDSPPAQKEYSARRLFKAISLHELPSSDRRLVEVLLLMPVAALLVCIFRNLIGLSSFGTFAPALIGLAFHDLNSLPGLVVFVSILLVGWLMRRFLDSYHLLQVPRVATMLTLIMALLVSLIVLSHLWGTTTTRYISLFPIVILTGMVERFWTLETEDSTYASFKTLLQTLLMSVVIAFVLSQSWLIHQLFCYPETLGLVMAGQLLIGRYTGYRLTELFRFRDLIYPPQPPGYVA